MEKEEIQTIIKSNPDILISLLKASKINESDIDKIKVKLKTSTEDLLSLYQNGWFNPTDMEIIKNYNYDFKKLLEDTGKISFKISILGDNSVGKRHLLRCFIEHKFYDPGCYKRTIGVEFREKKLFINGKALRILFWPIVDVYRFEFLKTLYFKGSSGGILVIDITRRSTLESMEKWIQAFREVCPSEPLLLVGNKIDLSDMNREFSHEEALEKAKQYGLIDYIETSAKHFIRVDDPFLVIAQKVSKLREKSQTNKQAKNK